MSRLLTIPDGYKIVTLLGSTKFKKEFLEVAAAEGLKNHLVFTVNWFSHHDGSMGEDNEKIFQTQHFTKIGMSCECVVVNPGVAYCQHCLEYRWDQYGFVIQNMEDLTYLVCHKCSNRCIRRGYIGSQTQKEIDYCKDLGILVRYAY